MKGMTRFINRPDGGWVAFLSSYALMCLVFATPHVFAQEVTVKRIAVVDEIGRGIASEIRAMDSADKETHFAYTNEKGIAEPNKACDSAIRLVPKPKVGMIYETVDQPPYCRPEVRIALKLARVKTLLRDAADLAFAKQNHSEAMVLYVESAARYAKSDPELAKTVQSKAYEAFQADVGSRYKIKVVDSSEGGAILNPVGIDFLKRFQANKKLPVTGYLDTITAEEMSGKKVFYFVLKAYDPDNRKP